MASPHTPKTSGRHKHNLCRADTPREEVMDMLDDYEIRLIGGIHNARKFDPDFDMEFAQFMSRIWDDIMRIMDEYGYEKE